MSGKKKRSRWIGALAALLGVVCALILCVLFYGTMVYQLAGESGGDAAPAGGTLALSAGTLEDESRQNIRMGGKTCDVLTRTYRLEGGAQGQAVTASPAAYIERMKKAGRRSSSPALLSARWTRFTPSAGKARCSARRAARPYT